MRVSRLLGVVVVILSYLPLVAVAALTWLAFGWRVPAAFAVYAASMGLFMARARRLPRRGGKVRAAAEFAGFALVGAVVGGFLFGGVGAIFGFALGLTFRLAEVPITGSHPSAHRPSR